MTFPFSAIVGQDGLQRALLLGVVAPALGGVLVRGTKGIAKSTAVRALAALLPPIETVAGCPFQRKPDESIPDWPLPTDAAVVSRPVALVELPLGATEDRVLGALHLEKALRGERAFEPGLLAQANRGLLYIDEVNLLPDHLVDVLLDAAASGMHRLEREGLSLTHPARFLLVGTMNPEEGELRPQLLDRFGLAVDVPDLTDAAQRAEAVRRRLAYQADPVGFRARWAAADAAVAARIVAARLLLPEVTISDELLQSLTARCLAASVEGLRADLTLCQAACAWAAYEGRREVSAADIDAVAELALAHRRQTPPEPPPSGRNGNGSRPQSIPAPPAQETAPARAPTMVREEIGDESRATLRPPKVGIVEGRRSPEEKEPGVFGRDEPGRSPLNKRIRWAATLRAAALAQSERGRSADQPLILRAGDFCYQQRRPPAGCLRLFVIDASGSMAAWRRMRETKAAVLALLRQAYQQRDRVALLTFRGSGAELILPPVQGLARARQALADLEVGGATPLAHGLAAARQFIRRTHRRRPGLPVWTVILTDGRTNVGHRTSAPFADALHEAKLLAGVDTSCLVIDTETKWPRFGQAQQLAAALGAPCRAIEDVIQRAAGFSLAVPARGAAS